MRYSTRDHTTVNCKYTYCKRGLLDKMPLGVNATLLAVARYWVHFEYLIFSILCSQIMYKVIHGLYHVIWGTTNVRLWPQSLARILPHLVRLLLKSPSFIRPIFCTVQSVALCHLLQSAELFFSMLSTPVKSLCDEMAHSCVRVCVHACACVCVFVLFSR